jgi:hypothetical protein
MRLTHKTLHVAALAKFIIKPQRFFISGNRRQGGSRQAIRARILIGRFSFDSPPVEAYDAADLSNAIPLAADPVFVSSTQYGLYSKIQVGNSQEYIIWRKNVQNVVKGKASSPNR